MSIFKMPVYMLEFTPKTIASLSSPGAIDGSVVDVDVYDRNNLEKKFSATGQRIKEESDMFRVTTVNDGKTDEHDWNFTIIRESADRSRKKR